jgi:hypothetical protein
VTANNRVATELPPTIACGFWEPPYRATRIAELLGQLDAAGVEDMARIQNDVLSIQAAGILGHLVRQIAHACRILVPVRQLPVARLGLPGYGGQSGGHSTICSTRNSYSAASNRSWNSMRRASSPGISRRFI